MTVKNIVIGSDHAGYEFKEAIKSYLIANDYDVTDIGTNSQDSVDYPDYGKLVASKVADDNSQGIIICGTGIGISIAANRNPKIRAALCTNSKMAVMTRLHNNANILALGARITPLNEAIEIVECFLSTEFEGGRHQQRIDKL